MCSSSRWSARSRWIIQLSTTISVTRRANQRKRDDPAILSHAPQGGNSHVEQPYSFMILFCNVLQSLFLSTYCSMQMRKLRTTFFACSWFTGEWSECSRSCNGGLRTREVLCKRRMSGTEEKVLDDSACTLLRPSLTEPCSNHSCPPEWLALDWSEVVSPVVHTVCMHFSVD